jgi:hypothetical protein
MAMQDLSLSKVYQLLEPGPVVLLTTARKGRANIMTMSWHMMVEFEPPLIACVVSDANFSFAALRATKECVIAVPARKLAVKVVGIGNCSGRDVDKFKKLVISPLPPVLLEPLQTAGPLRSAGITPLLRYYRPGRIPLAFHRLPGVTGYTASLLRRFRDGTRRASPVA